MMDVCIKLPGLFSDQHIFKMLTFSKKRTPNRDFWRHKCQLGDTKWRVLLLTSCLSAPRAVCFVSCSAAFRIFRWKRTAAREGQREHKGHGSPHGPRQSAKKMMFPLLSLIPMKITGWQGGCHFCLPRPLTADNYRSSRPAAMLLLSVEIASCCLRTQESDFN